MDHDFFTFLGFFVIDVLRGLPLELETFAASPIFAEALGGDGKGSAVAAGRLAESELPGLDIVGDCSPDADLWSKNMNFFPGNLGVVGVVGFSGDAST